MPSDPTRPLAIAARVGSARYNLNSWLDIRGALQTIRGGHTARSTTLMLDNQSSVLLPDKCPAAAVQISELGFAAGRVQFPSQLFSPLRDLNRCAHALFALDTVRLVPTVQQFAPVSAFALQLQGDTEVCVE